MIPCKDCDDGSGNKGYCVKTEYGWWEQELGEKGYACHCESCDKWTFPGKTIREAWENWDKANKK